jgi:hypothetical protein
MSRCLFIATLLHCWFEEALQNPHETGCVVWFNKMKREAKNPRKVMNGWVEPPPALGGLPLGRGTPRRGGVFSAGHHNPKSLSQSSNWLMRLFCINSYFWGQCAVYCHGQQPQEGHSVWRSTSSIPNSRAQLVGFG